MTRRRSASTGGRCIRSYAFQTKPPAASKGEWDYLQLVATLPPEKAYRPLADGGCPVVR